MIARFSRFAAVPCLVIGLAIVGPGPVRAGEPTPPDLDKIMKILDDLYRSTSSIARVELTVVTPRRERTLRMKMWTRGDKKALILIEAPARERGTATLKVDKNLWNYLPRISRTVRVPPSMMLSSWMGSDFTNDDVVRDASYADDFDSRVVGRHTKPTGWLIESVAKKGVVGLWKRIEMVVDDSGTLPLEARYYDRRNRHARTMYFKEIKQFDGRPVPTHLILKPVDKKGYRTEMRYLDIEFGAQVPESTFSLSRLERKR